MSPIPIEAYLTPRKTSAPGQVDDRSFEEENADSQHEDESFSTTVETKEDIAISPCQDEEAQPLQPDSETSTIEIDNGCTEESCKDDGEDDEVLSVNDKSESPTNEIRAPSEEQVSIVHQNGDLEFEDGELVPEEVDDLDNGTEAGGAADGLGTTDGEIEPGEITDKEQPKGKIKYDREFLMNVGQQVKQTSKPTVPVLSDVAKDANSMRSQHVGFFKKKSYSLPSLV